MPREPPPQRLPWPPRAPRRRPWILPGGFADAASQLTTNGYGDTAPFVGPVLRLTDGNSNETRSVWFNTAQDIARFSTEFTFRFSNATADGFTFTLQRVGSKALGGTGGNFGYRGLPTSAAIKFDLFPNLSTTGLYLNGAAPDDNTIATAKSSGAIDVTPAGLNFHDGDVFRAVLVYNGATLAETIIDLNTRASFTHSYTIDLASVLGGTAAYVGFTAGAGGLSSKQDILSWSFTSGTPAGKGN